LKKTDRGLLNRLAIDAEREADRQHEDGGGPCNFAPKYHPTPGRLSALIQRHLQARDALLQVFGFPASAKSDRGRNDMATVPDSPAPPAN
jgi:hypothetical protein